MYIIGTATTKTSDTTNESFFESPFIAPLAAMAAETPQIETAVESSIPISLSTPIFLDSQKEKYQTAKITITAWIIPYEPAFMISPNRIEVPNRTRPAFM